MGNDFQSGVYAPHKKTSHNFWFNMHKSCCIVYFSSSLCFTIFVVSCMHHILNVIIEELMTSEYYKNRLPLSESFSFLLTGLDFVLGGTSDLGSLGLKFLSLLSVTHSVFQDFELKRVEEEEGKN